MWAKSFSYSLVAIKLQLQGKLASDRTLKHLG
jgi:hypothetical protein